MMEPFPYLCDILFSFAVIFILDCPFAKELLLFWVISLLFFQSAAYPHFHHDFTQMFLTPDHQLAGDESSKIEMEEVTSILFC